MVDRQQGGGPKHTEIKHVGIIGAGQIGNGIVHVCALAGYDVYLHDVSQTALSAAPSTACGAYVRRNTPRRAG